MVARKDIDNKYKWNLSPIFKSDEEVYKSLENLKPSLQVLKNFKGKLGNKKDFLDFLELENKISLEFERIGVYAFLKHSENLEETKYVEMNNIIDAVAHKFEVETSFVEPELSNLDENILNSYLNDANFKDYHLSIKEIIRNKPHILSEQEETLISSVSKFAGEFSEIFDMFDCVDIKFNDAINSNNEKTPLTSANFSLLLENKDRNLRESTFKNYYKSFIDMSNTIATNYIANVKKDVVLTKLYKHNSTLEQSLFGGNIDKKVYNNLIKNVELNTPLLHKYYELKKKILKLDKFEYYDSYVSISDFEKNYSFEESVETVKQALKPMSENYVQLVDKALKENWIDVFPTKGKETGAYSIGLYGVHPYVLLNDVGNLNSVFTLIHELGHAFHSYYSDSSQPYELSNYPIFLAEIASTTNEVFLIKYLYKNAKSTNEKIYYLDKYLSMFKSTIFRQTMFSEFEDYAHNLIENDEAISKEKLNKYYGELNKRYHGNSIEHCNEIEYEWLRIPHFYNSYYVYKYATGLVSAINIANSILNNEPSALDNYMKFLKSGGSDYPTNILENSGVDLKTDKPYEVAFNEMKWALNELEKLI